MQKFSVLIVGGGPSGMFCALRLARSGVSGIAIAERNDRVGRKLSATGNGQGNVTNEHMSPSHYFSSTGSAEGVLNSFGKDDLLQTLQELGGLFYADETGRVYPASRQASSVTDLLRFALARFGVQTLTQTNISRVYYKEGMFYAEAEGEKICAKQLVLACGGKASPHFGSDGAGYGLAKCFGHTCTSLAPSLVQLKTDRESIRGLKGIRSDCEVSLLRGSGEKKREICRCRGDVLFTDYGVSGDAIFRTSAFVRERDKLEIDFLPQFMYDIVLCILRNKSINYPKMTAEDLLRCIVNSAVGKVVLRVCGVRFDARAEEIALKLPSLVRCIKGFPLEVIGCMGFDNAQVTKGGVCMDELDETLMSRKQNDLYLIGELVDVDGECGGYNLQWAFSSGAVAAEGIIKRGGYAV